VFQFIIVSLILFKFSCVAAQEPLKFLVMNKIKKKDFPKQLDEAIKDYDFSGILNKNSEIELRKIQESDENYQEFMELIRLSQITLNIESELLKQIEQFGSQGLPIRLNNVFKILSDFGIERHHGIELLAQLHNYLKESNSENNESICQVFEFVILQECKEEVNEKLKDQDLYSKYISAKRTLPKYENHRFHSDSFYEETLRLLISQFENEISLQKEENEIRQNLQPVTLPNKKETQYSQKIRTDIFSHAKLISNKKDKLTIETLRSSLGISAPELKRRLSFFDIKMPKLKEELNRTYAVGRSKYFGLAK
jgi:hypothetical protein